MLTKWPLEEGEHETPVSRQSKPSFFQCQCERHPQKSTMMGWTPLI